LSLNLYTYCRNNPIIRIDPSGYVDIGLREEVKNAGGKILRYNSKTKTAKVQIGNTITSFTAGEEGVSINSKGRMQVDDSLFYWRTGVVAKGALEYYKRINATGEAPVEYAGAVVQFAAVVTVIEGGAAIVKNTKPVLTNPTQNKPKPPGWNNDWKWRYPEGESTAKPRWFDPEGGEWRWHSPDKWHPTGHWDYNPWNTWNSPWQNIYK
jgi:hypothetical protein